MQAVGCDDYELVLHCAHELATEGLLQYGPMETPSWWSREQLREQYEEQERAKKQKAVSPSQAARNIDRAIAGVKIASQTELAEEQIQELELMGDVSKLSDTQK